MLVAVAAACACAPASASAQSSVLGIPCSTQSDGIRTCNGTVATTVRSWDGTPLDLDITLPPASRPGP